MPSHGTSALDSAPNGEQGPRPGGGSLEPPGNVVSHVLLARRGGAGRVAARRTPLGAASAALHAMHGSRGSSATGSSATAAASRGGTPLTVADDTVPVPVELLTPALRACLASGPGSAASVAATADAGLTSMEERVQAVERASLPLPPPQQARLNELAALPWWTKKYKGVYLTRGGYRASLWHSGRMQHCRVSAPSQTRLGLRSLPRAPRRTRRGRPRPACTPGPNCVSCASRGAPPRSGAGTRRASRRRRAQQSKPR